MCAAAFQSCLRGRCSTATRSNCNFHETILPGCPLSGRPADASRVTMIATSSPPTEPLACCFPTSAGDFGRSAAPLLKFLTGPLHSFFLAQSHGGGGASLGPSGNGRTARRAFFSSIANLLKTSDLRVITTYLDYLAAKKGEGALAVSMQKRQETARLPHEINAGPARQDRPERCGKFIGYD